MSGKLKDKIAIITGGLQGIGKRTVERFVSEGAKVMIWDIDESRVSEAIGKNSKSIFFLKVDTTKFPVVYDAAKSVFDQFGRIDILINNAGITRNATQLKMTQDQWQQVVDVNLTGVFNCTKAVAHYMVQSKYGRIINTSSMVGLYGNFGQTNYSAAKSGIMGITKVWARELSKNGITVNAVAPGVIETETMKSVPEEVLNSIKEKIPVGRIGSYEDIVNAYLFLASSEASYISGSVINVDGGFVA
ncbi:MAG TPA: 3-oxoacyl-ACP reductase FabG [Cytophagaceae bacterium]|jgi:3-oxoacyl-[acyl-carrier protein] reductase|nr:3-oxoacyl-ACP reductase FabG [Cytophagaceae bacterium]